MKKKPHVFRAVAHVQRSITMGAHRALLGALTRTLKDADMQEAVEHPLGGGRQTEDGCEIARRDPRHDYSTYNAVCGYSEKGAYKARRGSALPGKTHAQAIHPPPKTFHPRCARRGADPTQRVGRCTPTQHNTEPIRHEHKPNPDREDKRYIDSARKHDKRAARTGTDIGDEPASTRIGTARARAKGRGARSDVESR